MGTQRDVDLLHGIVIPDDRITADGMAARPLTGAGATATQSDFSQQSARPGIPASDDGSAMTLEATGEQTDKGHLEILTHRAGSPRPDDAGFVWRDIDAGDAATKYKGCDGYQSATAFEPVVFSTTTALQHHPAVCRLHSGKVLLTGHSISANDDLKVYEYDPTTSAWAPTGSPGHDPVGSNGHACIVQTNRKENNATTERVLLFAITGDFEQVDAYASDDDGASWFEYGRRVLDTVIRDSSGAVPSTFERITAAMDGDDVLMLIAFTDAGTGKPDVWHFASATRGGSFEKVESTYHATVSHLSALPNAIALPGGGFAIAGLWETGIVDDEWGFRRLGSAFNLIGEYTAALDANASVPVWDEPMECAAWFDEDGIGYAIVMHGRTTVPDPYRYRMFRSVDSGETWYEFTSYVFNFKQTNEYLSQMVATSTGGRALLLSRFVATTGSYAGNSIVCTYLGGFSDMTLPDSNADTDQNYSPLNRLTWGDTVDDTGTAMCMIPFQVPTLQGWSTLGTATQSIGANAEVQVSSTAITFRTYFIASEDNDAATMLHFAVRLVDGDGDKATDDIAIKIQLGDSGTYEHKAEIRLESDGFNVYDGSNPVLANVTGSPISIDLTDTVYFRVAMTNHRLSAYGHIQVWTSTPTHATTWTLSVDEDLGDNGATANDNRVEWGHFNAVSNVSLWRMFGFSHLPNEWGARDDDGFGYTWTNPDSLHPRALSSLPQLVFDGVKLAATSGPTRIGETWQIAADSQYPAAAVDPRVASSPSRGWRSADDSAQQILCWDIEPDYTDSGTWEGDAIACFVFGANWESGFLEAYNSSAGWVTLGQLVASDGFTTLEFTRRGRILYPDASQTIDGKRYFFREEHAGDTFDLGAAGDGGTRYHKIAHNAEGAWRGSGVTTKTPRVVLERDNLVSTDPASGTGELWRRDFGLIVSGVEALASYDHIRLRIPAQDTADGDLRIGTLVIGTVAVLARPYDWGWEYIHVQPISITNRPDDSIAARTTGKMRREIRFGWATTGIDVKQVNESIPDPDYVAIGSTDTPAGVEHDTSRQVEGIVRRSEQAACPVLLLTAIDHLNTGTTQKESRSRAMLLGRITTDPMTTAVLGDEGVDELERMQSITMVEEV